MLSGAQETLPAGQPESVEVAELQQRITRLQAQVEEASTLYAPAAAKSLLLMSDDADVTHVLTRHTIVRQDTHVIWDRWTHLSCEIPPYDRRLHRQIHRLLPCSKQGQDPLLGGSQPELGHNTAAAGCKLHGYSTTWLPCLALPCLLLTAAV